MGGLLAITLFGTLGYRMAGFPGPGIVGAGATAAVAMPSPARDVLGAEVKAEAARLAPSPSPVAAATRPFPVPRRASRPDPG